MVKCFKCRKIVNKKYPRIQCSKCTKWIHGDCGSITTEQLNALHATDALDWKCKICMGNTKRRISCILPDAEQDDFTDTETVSNSNTNCVSQQILREIRQQVREVIRDELQRSLQFYTDKIDDYEHKITTYENNIKILENKSQDLKNTNKHLELKLEVLEQKVNYLEQSQLAS